MSPPAAVQDRRAPFALALALAPLASFAALAAAGCGDGKSPPSACELDRLGCADASPTDDFYLPSCPPDVTGPLVVEVGTGESAFVGFDPGAGPEVHHGPQGGQHVFMGVRIANPRLDASPLVRLHFYLGQGDGCAPPADATATALPACAVTLGTRDLTLGGAGFEMHEDPDGAVSEWGLVVFVDVPSPTLPGVIAVSAEDQCHRAGASYQAWTTYL